MGIEVVWGRGQGLVLKLDFRWKIICKNLQEVQPDIYLYISIHSGQMQCWSILEREREGNRCAAAWPWPQHKALQHLMKIWSSPRPQTSMFSPSPNDNPVNTKSDNLYPKDVENPDMQIPDTGTAVWVPPSLFNKGKLNAAWRLHVTAGQSVHNWL